MKFAIIRRNGLGDFISATVPMCYYIKETYPDSELHLFLSEQNAELAKHFFPNEFVYMIPSGNKYLEAIKTALCHRDIVPDIGISPAPSYNKLCGIFLKLLGAKKIYGLYNAEDSPCVNFFYSKLIHPSNKDHVSLQNIKLFTSDYLTLPERFFPKISLKSPPPICSGQFEQRRLLIELSNNRKTSQLTNEKLALILNSMKKDIDFTVLISLKEKDVPKATTLQKLLTMSSRIVLSPSLDDFIQLINQSTCFLLGDGGAAHIAGALGKPGVALFGRTSVCRWGILSKKVIHLFDSEDVNRIDTDLIKATLLGCL